ncbi:LysR family transcriptional regulator [Prosthecomicrobium hirschii]|uniref:HTH-type transcriptional regulator CbbR n=1 Tax=Prosthecodimorpha hirschii TaxID=665126 RepID=A0A0P6VKH9_9HYPH|nr:LysR family transcriptional regulator [Prosthecomicrobium hirschii]KPL51631.1 LysR family transcriptional regulator [Prosthecomicrobium hirschii]
MRYVTLKQLRSLEAVVRSGSFAGAAELLHVTPPAVTVQMRQLEEAAGLPLVERLADGIRLTSAGREVLATVERIELALTDCIQALDEMRNAGRGEVAVGVISTAKYFAPRALAEFRRRFPGLTLKLFIGNRSEIIEQLRAGRIDVAIMGRPPEDLAVSQWPIGAHPHVIIAAPDHPLAAARGLSPADLTGESFLLREPGSGTRGLMERLFAANGVQPNIGFEIGSNETIKQAVMAGLGIAFISAHTIAAELKDGRLVTLDVAGLPILREWYVVHLRDRRLLPAPRALADFLAEEGAHYLPHPPGLAA